MRKDDPKRLKLQAERERTSLWFRILCKGIAGTMADADHDPESISQLQEIVNNELADAAHAAEVAQEAYRPYWTRRRVRLYRPRKAKKTKKVKK